MRLLTSRLLIRSFEAEHGHGLWAVERKDTAELIGDSGLMLVKGTGPEVEIVYVADRRARRQPK